MPQLVASTASLVCAAGTAPSALIVVAPTVTGEPKPATNILDNKPMVNILFSEGTLCELAINGVTAMS